MSTARAESRQFARHALEYLLSNLFVRGITFLLTPLYTRVLSPEDFAIVAIANTLASALGLGIGLAVHSAVTRLFAECKDEQERRVFFGTLLIFSTVVPTVFGLVLHLLGAMGKLDVFEVVRFEPHLKLVLWSAVAGNLCNLPVSVYMAREEPRKVSAFNIGSGLVQLLLNILFVVVLGQGALGILRAGLAANLVMAAVSVLLIAGMAAPVVSLRVLWHTLAFSLPLVPHLLANWALSVSDRLILERYVTQGDVGRYSLGYMFGLIVSVVAAAATNPINPAANRQLKDPEQAKNLPPLGTYALLGIVAFALPVSVSAREVVRIIAPRAYEGATDVVPWVVLGAVLQGVYLVWTTGTWYSRRTGLVPGVTLISALVNIGLNLWLVPRYGAIAAAWTTAVGYGVAALLHGLLAQRNHPIPWEYRRWVGLAVAGAATFALVHKVQFESPLVGLLAKTAACCAIFPLALGLTGFVHKEELSRLTATLRRRMGA